MYIRTKVAKYGSRFNTTKAVSFWECIDTLPEFGLGLKDFFKSKREFSTLGLFQRESGYHPVSASETELDLLEDDLIEALKGKYHPKRRRYRERVLHQIQEELFIRKAVDTQEMRFTRLIHRASQNLKILERAGWNIPEIFAGRDPDS